MSNKMDIREHNDSELSDLFMNDEALYYTLNSATWENVKAMAQACFIFDPAQLEELKETYEGQE